MADKILNDAQKKALDEVDSIFERAFQEAGQKIRSIREGNNDSFTHCLRCDCEYYVTPTPASANPKCARPGCGHRFSSHDWS